MVNFKVILKNLSTKNKFHLEVKYLPVDNQEIDFRFGNSSKSLERTALIFSDENGQLINPIKTLMINPKEYEKQSLKISQSKPFIYYVKGEIQEVSGKVLVKLVSSEYLLDTDKNYFVELEYFDKKSNRVQIHF